MPQEVLLYGHHAVFAALKNKNRKISRLLCTKENFEELKSFSVKAKLVEKKELDKILPDTPHQGIVLYCQPLENNNLEDIINLAEEKQKCHVLILDQVTDPQNIGAIIRSSVAFETLALIIQDKNSPPETGAMAKAASGMLEHLPISRVTNLSRAIEQLKKAGFWVIGLDGYAKEKISQINKSGKIAIVMGSEGKGMRRLVEENCDQVVLLPISSKVESLNVSTAAAITLYELNRE